MIHMLCYVVGMLRILANEVENEEAAWADAWGPEGRIATPSCATVRNDREREEGTCFF